ncbi:uncharacterized protein EI90DRAFT_3151020 [Cantharellus anzutake]|uniref:uncharacterized protein n=1 Tax=Cantharellus anzutake TaxID=1750568 RepID=UPI00190365C4|nr:uncharacterized protein EI90DRAFT_3151020 [Cantharellus anzutake]KAF8340747.1 hypothetical protein EI90DRAFT_3151020 [Cantharellus anzutake]
MPVGSSLLFPLTLRDGGDGQGVNIVDEAFSSSTATALAAYPGVFEPTTAINPPQWIAVGCTDGSIFMLSHGARDNLGQLFPRQLPRMRPTSPVPSISSIKSSGNHFSPTNIVPSRSLAISDLSMDEAQAPMNFIDHDDEHKLRALLHTQSAPAPPKDREALPPAPPRRIDIATEQTTDKPSLKPPFQRTSNAAVLADTYPGSSLGSRNGTDEKSLYPYALRYHLYPPQTSSGNSTVFLEFINDGNLLLSLQTAGRLSVYSVLDGLCLISVDLGGPPRCQAPVGYENVPADSRLWEWKGLNIIPLSSLIVYITASDPFQFSQLDLPYTDTMSTTRVSCLKLNLHELRPFLVDDEAVEWLGEWIVQGPASASGAFSCPTDNNPDQVLCYRLSESHIFLVTPVNFLPKSSSGLLHRPVDDRGTNDASSNQLHLPRLPLSAIYRPFKIGGKLIPRRQASLYEHKKDDIHFLDNRVLLGDNISTPGIDLDGRQVKGERVGFLRIEGWGRKILWRQQSKDPYNSLGDGYLRVAPLSQLVHGLDLPRYAGSKRSLHQPITSLHVTLNYHVMKTLVVAGTADGTVSLWETGSLNLLKKWTIFHDALRYVITLPDPHPGRMHDCVLCMSISGTIAVISVETLQLLYVIPGSVAPLERIWVSANSILLLYGNSRTRLWDTNTLEFWRSMGQDQAMELLSQGGWFDAGPLEQQEPDFPCWSLGRLDSSAGALDVARTVIVDAWRLLGLAPVSASLPPTESDKTPEQAFGKGKRPEHPERPEHSPPSSGRDEAAMLAVSFLITQEETRYANFGAKTRHFSSALVGMYGYGGSVAIPAISCNTELSLIYKTRRLFALALAFRQAGLDPTKLINKLLSQAGLAQTPRESCPNISFPLLGSIWSQSSGEEKYVARYLFDAGATLLSDRAATDLFDEWQHYLPFLQADAHKQFPISALALFVVGNVAVEKYAICSPSTLIDVSRSIKLYMSDDQSPHRATAIDLCSRGFHIWRIYVNAMDLLRSLSRLAVGTPAQKDSTQLRNLVQLARTSVLQIAKANTPLFISTISLDIMDTNSVEYRSSTMQLIAYIIRRDRMILYPNLPRLVEAVVKSLDPNSSAREVVLDSAIEFLGQVVRTYASIDFYMPTQRLAVGTNEGALIMYDLKLASRLYVLDGHKQRLSACTFSPDGRRLITVSLEEGLVMVWKVGSSLVSFFMPGAPPRQGNSSSEPFKKFPITVRTDTTYEQLCDSLVFDWPGPRTARVTIGESVFTFAT